MLSPKAQPNLGYPRSQSGHFWHRAPRSCRSSAALGSLLPFCPLKLDQPENSCSLLCCVTSPHHPSSSPPLSLPCPDTFPHPEWSGQTHGVSRSTPPPLGTPRPRLPPAPRPGAPQSPPGRGDQRRWGGTGENPRQRGERAKRFASRPKERARGAASLWQPLADHAVPSDLLRAARSASPAAVRGEPRASPVRGGCCGCWRRRGSASPRTSDSRPTPPAPRLSLAGDFFPEIFILEAGNLILALTRQSSGCGKPPRGGRQRQAGAGAELAAALPPRVMMRRGRAVGRVTRGAASPPPPGAGGCRGAGQGRSARTPGSRGAPAAGSGPRPHRDRAVPCLPLHIQPCWGYSLLMGTSWLLPGEDLAGRSMGSSNLTSSVPLRPGLEILGCGGNSI